MRCLIHRELQKNGKIEAVYEVESWQPNTKIAKTIIASLKFPNGAPDSLFSLILYYPVDEKGFVEFPLDTFHIKKADFKIEQIFTANFDKDPDVEIGLLYSCSLQDTCKKIAYRTVYYKKPRYWGIYREFTYPIFFRAPDDRFACTECVTRPGRCNFDTARKIIKYLSNSSAKNWFRSSL